ADGAFSGSIANLTRQEIETDERVDLELPALELRKKVRAAGDEHRARTQLGGHPRRVSRSLRPQIFEPRQPEHSGIPRRRLHPDHRRIWDVRKMVGTVAWRLSFFL